MNRGRKHLPGALLAASLLVLAAAPANRSNTHPAKSPVTITVWDWHYADTSPGSLGLAMRQVDKAFAAAYPNIIIKHVGQPFNSYFTLERAAVASKRGPDVVFNYASPAIFDYYQGLLPLTNYVTPDQRKNLTGWEPVSTGLSAHGTPYGVPYFSQGLVFYYNKALFRRAGLNPQTPPTTWAQLLADCAALKKAGIVPIVAGFKDGYYAEWWTATLATQLMSPKEAAASLANPNWASPANVKGLNAMLDLVHKGYMTPNAVGIPLFPDAGNNFGAGKGAMFLGLAADNDNWSAFKPTLGANLGDMLMPVLPGSYYSQPRFDLSPGTAWSITRWSKHPKEAYTYISFLVTAANEELKYRIAGSISNNVQAKLTNAYEPANRILQWARDPAHSFISPMDEIRTNPEATFDKLITSVVAGQMSLSDALQQVETTQTQIPPLPGA